MTEKKAITVAICTPYLTANLETEIGEKETKIQAEKYGYDPNNFKDMKLLETPEHVVFLEKAEFNGEVSIMNGTELELADLVVMGSTENAEEVAMELRGSGIMIARYSIFYGGASKYTGNTPEQGGYSLDIPKNFEVVKALLTNDGILKAIRTRTEPEISAALKEFNNGRNQPVLTTPYLSEALKVKK